MRILIAALALALPTLAHAQDANGIWKTQVSDKGAYLHVRIAPCAYDTARTCGVIEEAVNATRTDLIGKAIIRDMRPNGAGKWNKGQIWAPDDDKTYRSNMQLTAAGLKVEGCVAVFCRGQVWTRIK